MFIILHLCHPHAGKMIPLEVTSHARQGEWFIYWSVVEKDTLAKQNVNLNRESQSAVGQLDVKTKPPLLQSI